MRKQLVILAAACVAVTAMGASPVQGRLENVKRLTSQSDVKFENPSFSPDGKQIAFTRLGYEGLYVMDANGANLRAISQVPGVGYMYQWSPDSKQILALEASCDQSRTLTPNLHAVVVLSVADGERVQITEPLAEVRPAAWRVSAGKMSIATSDKGIMAVPGKIAADAAIGANATPSRITADYTVSFITDFDNLYVVDAQGNRKVIYNGTAFLPKLSPDGKRVVFCDINDDIRVMGIDGTGMTVVAKGFSPCWVNDTQIVYERTTDDGHSYESGELFLGNIAAKTEIALTDTPRAIEMNPSVSPDGKQIIFVNHNDGQVYIADLK